MFNVQFLSAIRAYEIVKIEQVLPPASKVLEIGGGTGQQAKALSERGFRVVSVDIDGSIYKDDRVFPVMDYDGRNLPFPDATFDVVLSSNVLEHVTDLSGLHKEMARVLRPGGIGIHIMPTHSWRLWTSVAHYIELVQRLFREVPQLFPRSLSVRAWIGGALGALRNIIGILRAYVTPPRHGERGNFLTEIGYFHPAWWRRNFLENGYVVSAEFPMGLFYTGHMILGPRISLDTRKRLGSVLGCACHLFIVRPAKERGLRK